MINNLIKLFEKYREIIMYLITGGATTVISWGTYYIFALILPFSNNIKIIIANIISWIFAMTFAYVTNKILVFQSYSWKKKFVIKEFFKFASARLATGIFEIIAVPLLVYLGLNQAILGSEGMLSKIIVSIVVVILNYIVSKFFIF